MIKPSISILGCGWLGFPLAIRLVTEGYKVKGSTTDASKFLYLKKSGIESYLIKCNPNIEGEQLHRFFQSDILILTLPFLRSFPEPTYYLDQIESVVFQVHQSSIKFVIFSSSTSVYRADSQLVSEDDQIIPDNPRSSILLKIEKLLLESGKFQSTIIRFAGLYGGDRQLGRFLKNALMIDSNGLDPVNLIHQDDCIEIVCRIIQNNLSGEVFNAVSDCHPTRQELYTHKARELGIKPPVFAQGPLAHRKIVSNTKLKAALKYQFIHPDPLS